MNHSQAMIDALEPEGRMLARISTRSALATDFLVLMERLQAYQPADFRVAVLEQNALSRASHSARSKLLQELKGRYLLNADLPLFASFLAEWRAYPDFQNRQLLAYTLFNLNDRTVYVASCEWLYPRIREASSELRLGDLLAFFRILGTQEHPEITRWAPTTLTRVAQHYLASIRDFGLATGGVRKVAVRPSLRPAPIRLLLRALRLAGIPHSEIIRHPGFKILGISPAEVVDVLGELNRQGALRFRMQADVIELEV